MKTFLAALTVAFLLGHFLAGCSFTQRIEMECWTNYDEKTSTCRCRDQQTGQFVSCP